MYQTCHVLKGAGWFLAAIFFAGVVAAQEIAFSNPTSLPANGLQVDGDDFLQPFALGLEFTVVSPVLVSQLGAYDATIGGSGLGFGTPVYVAIYSEDSQSVVSPIVTFSGTAGTVVDSYRFQTISNFVLNPGAYMLIADGYGLAGAPDWNAVVAGISPSPLQFDTGGGALANCSTWYASDPGSQLEPATIFGGPGALVAAGSFAFVRLDQMSSTFSFTLDEPCKTSAGVFASDGTLLRTLWSKVRYPAGTHSAVWDGLDDNGNLVLPGVYQIKLLQHNTEYVWDGAIGNTSAEISGPTVHRGFWPVRDLAISGTNAFYVSGYNEGGYAFRNFLTTDPQHVKMAWYWVNNFQIGAPVSKSGDINDLNWLWVTADSNRVYFACSGTPNPANLSVPYVYPGCIVSCNLADNSPAYFTNGIPIYNKGANSPLPNGIYVGTNVGLSGLSVQQNGNLLAASVTPDNTVYLLDKKSGSPVANFSVNSPRRLNFSPDGSLWVISSNSVICFTNLPANPAVAMIIPDFSEPLDVAVCPTNSNFILVADGGVSQQVKAFDRSGNSLWIYGLAGGYQANGVAVAINKFWFFDGENDGTFLCFAPDGSFWVGDGANNRSLHFSANLNYLEQIMYQPRSWTACVDQNNPCRVFNQFMEFKVDYSKPLGQGWTVVNNWRANVDPCHITLNNPGIREVTTFTNGRTYALIDHNCMGNTLPELCELVATNGLRCTGIYPMVTNQGRWTCFGPDGSARATAFGLPLWYESTLSGFDTNNNPIWNPESLIATASDGVTDPVPRCCSFGNVRATISSNNILISFDQTLNDGWHLGGIRVGATNWLWKASPAVPEMNGTGNFEISGGVLYPGNSVQAVDRQVIFGYHGEYFRGQGQAGQNMHFLDDGLFVGQFGEASPGHYAYECALPGFAGNGDCPSLIKTTNGDFYLWVNDESAHGPQRWHFVNARNIREQSGCGALGSLITLTNAPCGFPTGVIGQNGNQSGKLSWLPVPGATSYNVYYSPLNGGPYGIFAGNTTNHCYVAPGLTNGQTVYFVVTAMIAGMEGIPSEQVPINPFDTSHAVLCVGSMSEGGLETPVVDVSSAAPLSGQPAYLGAEHLTGLLNPRELDYYGFGNLQNETLGTKGYAIYDWNGPGTMVTNVLAPFTITPGFGWTDIGGLERQLRVDYALGATEGWVANPVGSIGIEVNDTNFHSLTVISPAQIGYPRQFTMRLISTNNTSAAFAVNESIGYSHVFQFLFRGNVTLSADATGGSGAIVQALFLDDAAVLQNQVSNPSTTSVISSQNPASAGSSVTFSATVNGPGGVPSGAIAFEDGANILGSVTLDNSGAATFSTSALSVAGSPHSITAIYAGDNTFGSSVSSALLQVITHAGSVTPPVLTNARMLGNGVFQFCVCNTQTASLAVLSTTNLWQPMSNWTVLGAPSNIAPGLFQFTSPPMTNDQQRYYRVMQSQ